MRPTCLVLFLASLTTSLTFAQERIPIRGSKSVRLSKTVHEAVRIGGVKDRTRCGASGEIYTLANRGYSDASGSVVRITPDGKDLVAYSLDRAPGLESGDIVDFYAAPEGAVFALAREVTKYSNTQVPTEFGASFILRFAPTGILETKIRLPFDFGQVNPSAIQVLTNRNFLIAGYSVVKDQKLKEVAYLVGSDGALIKNVDLPGEPSQASNAGAVSSRDVYRPTILESTTEIFILRGSTRDPVYVLSKAGELTRTVRLKADNLEFSTPRLSGDKLIVHKQLSSPATDEIRFRDKPELEIFPVFSVHDGRQLKQYEWRQMGQLACYDDASGLTFLQDVLDYPANDYWAIVKANSAKSITAPELGDAEEISLQLKWIIPCTDDAVPVPVLGDEAARAYCLSPKAIVTEHDLSAAGTYVDGIGRPGLRLTFTSTGAAKLRRATSSHDEGEIGFLISGVLVFHAVVLEPLEHEAVITGSGMTERQVQQWVELLNQKLKTRQQQQVSWRGSHIRDANVQRTRSEGPL